MSTSLTRPPLHGWSMPVLPSGPPCEFLQVDLRPTLLSLQVETAMSTERAQLMFLIEISMLTVSGMGILVTERRAVWSLAVEISISSKRL